MEWVNKYYLTRLYFTLEGMIARIQLAVLDYNCGTNNTQITTKDGERKKKKNCKIGLRKNIRIIKLRIHKRVIIFHIKSIP